MSKKKQNKDLESYRSLNEQFWDFIFCGIERAIAIGKRENNVAPPSSQPEKEGEKPKQGIPQIARY